MTITSRRGRPTGKSGNQERRTRLLEAALAMFARHGIAQTSLRAIAREAGVTSAMVNYYFATRDQLLDVLIDEYFAPLYASFIEVFDENPDDPIGAIEQLVHRLVDTASEQPWFASLWMREVISVGGLLHQRMHKSFGEAPQKRLMRSIARWQAEGRLNDNLDPSLVFLTVLGVAVLPLATSELHVIHPARRNSDSVNVVKHSIALLMHGMRP